jgi:hypothetical protein
MRNPLPPKLGAALAFVANESFLILLCGAVATAAFWPWALAAVDLVHTLVLGYPLTPLKWWSPTALILLWPLFFGFVALAVQI